MTLKWSSYSVGCWIYWTWNPHVELLQLQPKMLVDGDGNSTFSAYEEPTPCRNRGEKVTEWEKVKRAPSWRDECFTHIDDEWLLPTDEKQKVTTLFLFLFRKVWQKEIKKSLTGKKMYTNNRGFHRDREESGAVIMDTVVSHYHSR